MRYIKCIVLLACLLAVSSLVGCGKNETAKTTESVASTESSQVQYETKLFDQSYVHEIDVTINEEDWEDLLANPTKKTKYQVDVEIDGEKIENVSFSTKGNTSLSSVASDSESDRYSFKVNFGKYEEGQTYYGLDKLNLNNIYADATYMKDYLSYELFRKVGVDAPLTSYVQLKINGEDFGLYLGIEEIGTSYLSRNNEEESELYKPETARLANMGGPEEGKAPGDGERPEMPENGQMPDEGERPELPENSQIPEEGERPEFPDGEQVRSEGERPEMPEDGNMRSNGERPELPDGEQMPDRNQMGKRFGETSSGAAIVYTDDTIESYSDIFDNAETDVTDEDKQRVIQAIKKLSEGSAEEALDTEEVINYFVAHNFVMNYDSYTGTMLHNYYLKETDGKLSILPWDYNLAFGAFSGAGKGEGGDATSLVNCGIDSPLSGTSEEDRPLWNFIVSNEEYLEQYHESFGQLVEYVNSQEFEKEMNRVYEMIHPYVEKDASAFYSLSEFEQAYDTLLNFCKLRAESVTKQLDGTLSTVTETQDSEDKIDASSINISVMGTQNNRKKSENGVS